MNNACLRSSMSALAFAVMSTSAWGQGAQDAGTPAQSRVAALEEIIVTAQRREQSLQSVPIAVTALSAESMQVNRVRSVIDLSSLAPNVTVRPAAGGSNIASFNMRGITSYGVVAGSDRSVSLYQDGVYLSSPRGSIFHMPDLQQLEVLRGPQGTLFGRNATAGAINMTTRDPSGEFGVIQEFGVGNRDYFRSRTTVDLPEWNGLSAMVTYVAEEQDGPVRNLGAGAVWDRTAFGKGFATSPRTLGDTDAETIFVAVKYEPSDTFRLTYKFDYSTDNGTPAATALLANNPGVNPLLDGLLASNPPVPIASDGRRPSAVNNEFHIPIDQTVWGHNLTAVWQVSDNLTLKNIFGYREVEGFVGTDISGLGGLRLFGPLAAALGAPEGSPVCIICAQPNTKNEQWSNEIQLNYSTDALTLTAGALYHEQEDESGGPPNGRPSFQFGALPGFMLPPGNTALSLNEAKSQAIYAQAEFHLNPQIDVILGGRITRDEKSGTFLAQAVPDGPINDYPFDFTDTNPSYMVSVNYKPTDSMLLYLTHAEAFVSGGSVGGVEFDKEEAVSWEAGMKVDFMDNRIRTNLAVFDVVYDNVQTSQSGRNVGRPDLGTLIVDLGGQAKARGVEFEGSAVVGHYLTLNASLGYINTRYTETRDILVESVGGELYPGSSYQPTLNPDWTGSLSAQYQSDPIFGTAYVSLNVTGLWRDRMRLESNPARAAAVPQFGAHEFSPPSWVLNARASLREIDLGQFTGEIALWGRNLLDADEPAFALNAGSFTLSANYANAKSYGLDVILRF